MPLHRRAAESLQARKRHLRRTGRWRRSRFLLRSCDAVDSSCARRSPAHAPRGADRLAHRSVQQAARSSAVLHEVHGRWMSARLTEPRATTEAQCSSQHSPSNSSKSVRWSTSASANAVPTSNACPGAGPRRCQASSIWRTRLHELARHSRKKQAREHVQLRPGAQKRRLGSGSGAADVVCVAAHTTQTSNERIAVRPSKPCRLPGQRTRHRPFVDGSAGPRAQRQHCAHARRRAPGARFCAERSVRASVARRCLGQPATRSGASSPRTR